MIANDTPDPEVGAPEEQQLAVARKNRGVRFSDSEWDEVREAAQADGVTPAEFVRERILAITRDRADTDATADPASLAPLIERTFRYTWMLATLKRDELVQAGRGEEMEKLVRAARELQDKLLKDDPVEAQ